MNIATTRIGTWSSSVNLHSSTPEYDINSLLEGTANYPLLVASGALDALQAAYRAAIDDTLPPSVSLCGDEFIADVDADDWGDYPRTESGTLDIAACVESVDLGALAEEFDVITLDEVGRTLLKSTAANPASAASQALKRLGVRPLARCQVNGQGQVVSVYYLRDVTAALAARPGRGKR